MENDYTNIEDKIEKYLNKMLKSIWLNEEIKASLRQFLYFCINTSKNEEIIPYNVLIETYSSKAGITLGRTMRSIGMEILKCNGKECTEEELNQYVLNHEEKALSISLVTDMLPTVPQNWDKVFNGLQANNKMIKIYVKNDQENKRLEEDSYFRWRFLNLHIKMKPIDSKDAYEYLLLKLEQKGYSFEDSFKSGIKEYVSTIYPTAKYQDEEFVLDAVKAVEQRMLSTGENVKLLKEKDIPLYKKNTAEINIPTDVQEISHDKTDDKMNPEIENLMILALSTRNPQNESSKSFLFEERSYRVDDCIYQMEPVTKYMLDCCKGQTVYIIELSTPKTREKIRGKDGEIGLSAEEFYKMRILEYNAKQNLKCRIEFIPVEILENNYNDGIVEAINRIREHKPQNGGKIWVDPHGGFRDISLVLNSLISLLKVDNIFPDHILGVRNDSTSATGQIVDQSDAFSMNTFVSGMNEFIKYGSAELLSEYFNNNKDEQVEKIVSIMREISDGTKLCDPQKYIAALDNLGDSINKYTKSGVIFDIFIDYIIDDYKILLDKNKRRTLDVINRCYEKGLYQQALTFIESLMPEDFVRYKVVYFEEDQRDIIEENKKWYESEEHFALDSFNKTLFYYDKDTRQRVDDQLKNEGVISKEISDAEALELIRTANPFKKRFSPETKWPFIKKKEYSIDIKEKKEVKATFILKTQLNNKTSEAGELLRLHNALKQIRNLTNHSKNSINRPTVEDIKYALDRYILLANDILNEDNFTKAENISGSLKLVNSSKKRNDIKEVPKEHLTSSLGAKFGTLFNEIK